jgi:hypothetical protein
MALNIGKEITALKRMTVPELRRKYARVFGEDTTWVFRPIPDSDSDSFRTSIPIHSGQRFRPIPDNRKACLRGCLAG